MVGATAGKLAAAVALGAVGFALPTTAAIVGMGGVGVLTGGVGPNSPVNAMSAATAKATAPPVTHSAILRPCEGCGVA